MNRQNVERAGINVHRIELITPCRGVILKDFPCNRGASMGPYSIFAVKPAQSVRNEKEYWKNQVYQELLEGRARFGYSGFDEADLLRLKSKIKSTRWSHLPEQQREVWSNAAFLLNVKVGDYFIYLDVPGREHFAVVCTTGSYKFSDVWDPNSRSDFRHVLQCRFIAELNMSDEVVRPFVEELNFTGLWHKIGVRPDFEELLKKLQRNGGKAGSQGTSNVTAKASNSNGRHLKDQPTGAASQLRQSHVKKVHAESKMPSGTSDPVKQEELEKNSSRDEQTVETLNTVEAKKFLSGGILEESKGKIITHETSPNEIVNLTREKSPVRPAAINLNSESVVRKHNQKTLPFRKPRTTSAKPSAKVTPEPENAEITIPLEPSDDELELLIDELGNNVCNLEDAATEELTDGFPTDFIDLEAADNTCLSLQDLEDLKAIARRMDLSDFTMDDLASMDSYSNSTAESAQGNGSRMVDLKNQGIQNHSEPNDWTSPDDFDQAEHEITMELEPHHNWKKVDDESGFIPSDNRADDSPQEKETQEFMPESLMKSDKSRSDQGLSMRTGSLRPQGEEFLTDLDLTEGSLDDLADVELLDRSNSAYRSDWEEVEFTIHQKGYEAALQDVMKAYGGDKDALDNICRISDFRDGFSTFYHQPAAVVQREQAKAQAMLTLLLSGWDEHQLALDCDEETAADRHELSEFTDTDAQDYTEEIFDPDRMRELPRNYVVVRLPLLDLDDPNSKGYLRDITEKGLQSAGIEVKMGEIKRLLIQADQFGEVEPFSFDAQCRWVKPDEDEKWCAGFLITNISSHGLHELRKLIGLLSFKY